MQDNGEDRYNLIEKMKRVWGKDNYGIVNEVIDYKYIIQLCLRSFGRPRVEDIVAAQSLLRLHLPRTKTNKQTNVT